MRTRLPALLASLATTAAVLANTSPLSAAPAAVLSAPAAQSPVDSVLAISLDGLNPVAIRQLGPDGAPNLYRFMRAGASTLNARTEFEQTVTLPNHTGMVTGLRINARHGGHGVTWNDERLSPARVQDAAGHEVASVFTAVDANGGSSALFASKVKFSLWQRSWPESIDRTTIVADNGVLVGELADDLAAEPRAFRFLHLSLPDAVGHEYGFMSPSYFDAVRRVDVLVGRAVEAAKSAQSVNGPTAVVLTSDHGGRGADHSDATSPQNYRVAFMVRGPGVARGADLYDLNPDFRDPGKGRPSYRGARQPVRNGAVANLSLDLLGWGPVPGSEHDVEQTLDVR